MSFPFKIIIKNAGASYNLCVLYQTKCGICDLLNSWYFNICKEKNGFRRKNTLLSVIPLFIFSILIITRRLDS